MNLLQVIRSDSQQSAYRVVGTQRIIVELGEHQFRVLIQYWNRRRWTIPEYKGVRYLNGVLRDGDGSWVVVCDDLTALSCALSCLPTIYQHLLTPDSDDWQPSEGLKGG
ncbi:hypothetical protein [Ktedonospora formicarum]|uniref:Uncharacterized protein n=1 Tax=Ktedonospora formicarum TaxID=2778364 RepID=A0A8J3MYK3_9CHLR|nr:hypothetical protein [Ktedonospora formicarum]GHO50908.1 hypothetical protein KSX_90710 [Ktedonospora formicarum]